MTSPVPWGAPSPRVPHPSRPDLRRSVPQASGLARPRLLARLDEVLEVRLTAVVAPPGAGKTNLMAWWARRAPVDVVWHRAGPGDASPTQVLTRLGDALQPLVPARPAARCLDTVIGTIAAHNAPLVLVIDDFHLIDRPPVTDLIQALLLDAPDNLHLLVGSRRPPGFNLARTEISNMVLTGQELRLRPDETARLFHEVYGAPLSTRDTLHVTHQTEGWAAAVRLLHLSVADLPAPDRQVAVRGRCDRMRYAGDYLHHQVLGGLSDPDLDFLRRTSVLETLTQARCDLLLGTDDAHTTLARVEGALGLLVTHGRASSWRLHRVVRAHLAAQLRDLWGDVRVAEWTRRAADLLCDEGDPAAAVRALAGTEDWSALRRLLTRAGPAVVTARETTWLDSLPAWVLDQEPWLQLTKGVRALRQGSLAEASRLADLATAGFEDPDVVELCRSVARCSAVWAGGDAHPSAAWAEQLRSVVGHPRPDRREWPGVPAAEAALLRSIGLAVVGDLRAARRLLARSLRDLEPTSAAAMSARLLAVALGEGEADSARTLADHAEELGMPWLARLAHALAVAPEYLLTGVGPAADPLDHEVADADLRGDDWGAALLTAIRCVALLRAGRPEHAELDDLIHRFRTLGTPALEAWARALQALAGAVLQEPDAIRSAESAEGLARCAGTRGALAVTYAAAALARGGEAQPMMLDAARLEAEGVGLDVQPWTWLTGSGTVPASWDEPARPPARTDAVPVVAVRCFARFELSVDGAPPPLSRIRPRARELLRLLTLHAGRSVHRETLVDALWRDLDPASGLHNLHVCVSSLRAALEPDVQRGQRRLIVRDGDRYALAIRPGSRSDLLAFDASTAAAERSRVDGDTGAAIHALDRALTVYTGDVLPEDGPAEWVVATREQYRMRAADAAVLLAQLRLAHKQPEAAAAAVLRAIDLDPCRDSAWRLLIDASHAAGDLAAAERARRSYADVLASLGLVSDSASAVRPPPQRRGQ